MFVPREKNINVIEESFVLLKPDVAESHGILIDIFTSAGFSVSAKKIPRSKDVVETIVKYFPCREVGGAGGNQSQRGGARFGFQGASSSRIARYGSLAGATASGGGESHSSPSSQLNINNNTQVGKLTREDSVFSNKNKNHESDLDHGVPVPPSSTGGEGQHDANNDDDNHSAGMNFARMRQHRSALTTASPLANFVASQDGSSPGRNNNNTSNNNPNSSFHQRQSLFGNNNYNNHNAGAGGGGGALSSPPAWGSASLNFYLNNNQGHDQQHQQHSDEFFKTNLPTYGDQLKFVLQGTTLALVVSAANAVEATKLLCGPESPAEAKEQYPNSIRAEFGTNLLKNAIFCAPTHDVASELIELVFGYQTEQRTEVVRFGNAMSHNNNNNQLQEDGGQQQQQQQQNAFGNVDGLTLEELEAADNDILSAALDAAIFGADVPLPTLNNQSSTNHTRQNNNNNKKNNNNNNNNNNGENNENGENVNDPQSTAATATTISVSSANNLQENNGDQKDLQSSNQNEPSSLNSNNNNHQQNQGNNNNNNFTNNNNFFQQQQQQNADVQRQLNILRAREVDLMLRERSLAESSWMFRGDGVRIADPPKTGRDLFVPLNNNNSSNNNNNNNNNSKDSATFPTLVDGDHPQEKDTKSSLTNNNNNKTHLPGNRKQGQHASWTTLHHPNAKADAHLIRFINDDDLEDFIKKNPNAKIKRNGDIISNNTISNSGSSGNLMTVGSGTNLGKQNNNNNNNNNNPKRTNSGRQINDYEDDNDDHVILPMINNNNSAKQRGVLMAASSFRQQQQQLQENNNNNNTAPPLPASRFSSGINLRRNSRGPQDMMIVAEENNTGIMNNNNNNMNTITAREQLDQMLADEKSEREFMSMQNNAASGMLTPYQIQQQQRLRGQHQSSSASRTGNERFENINGGNATTMMNFMPTPPRSNHLGNRGAISTTASNIATSSPTAYFETMKKKQIEEKHGSPLNFSKNRNINNEMSLPSVASLIDPTIVFECGSDTVKLKNLFEKFEKLAKERMSIIVSSANNSADSDPHHHQNQQLHQRFGRLIPKSDFVEFVRNVFRHTSCGDGDRQHEAMMLKPILQYVDATCGRAGPEWVAFDEFVMVLMKIMQT